MRVNERIRHERLAAGITQSELATAIGCSKSHLSLMEAGHRTASSDWVSRIEQALEIDDRRLSSLMQWEQTPPELRQRVQAGTALVERFRTAARRGESLDALLERGELQQLVEENAANVVAPIVLDHRIPVINKVAAGYPREFTDLDYPATVADDYIACPDVQDPDAFAARVVGDSMAPEYTEGEVVVFSPALPTPSGSDCFVRLLPDNETTFKRIYIEDDRRTIRLQPLNSVYPPRLVDREDIGGMYAAAYVLRRVVHDMGG